MNKTNGTGLELSKLQLFEHLRNRPLRKCSISGPVRGGPGKNDETQVGATFHKNRVGKHIDMVEGSPPTAPERPKRRLPRIIRYMALAIYYEDLIRHGYVRD